MKAIEEQALRFYFHGMRKNIAKYQISEQYF